PVELQKKLAQFADLFESLFSPAVTFESFADARHLFGANTDLAGFVAGGVDIEHPLGVPFAGGALGTAGGVKSGALQQGAAQQFGETGKRSGDPDTFLGGAFACDLYR